MSVMPKEEVNQGLHSVASEVGEAETWGTQHGGAHSTHKARGETGSYRRSWAFKVTLPSPLLSDNCKIEHYLQPGH